MYHARRRVAVALTVAGLILLVGGLLGSATAAASVRSPGQWTRSQLRHLQSALMMYESDQGRLPRGSARLDDDDAPWLCAALLFSPQAGGGANGPYLHLPPEQVGVLDAGGVGAGGVRALTPGEQGRLQESEFQRAHGPESAAPLVFLDPWGRPVHARFWSHVRVATRDRLRQEPWVRGPFDRQPAFAGARAPLAHPVHDGPHDAESFDLWSDGPNGVNEYGASCSDDVTSWRQDFTGACTCRPAWLTAATRPHGLALLAGVLGLFGGAGLGLVGGASLRRLRLGRRPGRRTRAQPRVVTLRAASAAARCAYCHGGAEAGLLACAGCGAGLHRDCWRDAGACPTLGCEAA